MKPKRKKIIVIISITILTLALFCVGGYFYLINKLKSALTGCRIETEQFMETVDFELVDNWIIINVKVEGNEKEYPFFFDTGATTIVSDSLLRDLNKNNYKLFSSNDKKDTTNAFHNKLYILNGLSLGKVKFKDIGAMNLDNNHWEMLNCVSPYGIIGCNIIENACFQIDYINKKITITDQVEKLPNYKDIKWLNYRTDKQETPIINAVLEDNTSIDLFFDTGSSGGITLYSPSIFDNKCKQLDSKDIVKFTSIPNLYIRGEKPTPYKSIKYKPSNFTFFGDNIPQYFEITVSNTPEKNFTGIAGNSFLKHFNITLDYKNKRVGYVFQEQIDIIEDKSFGFSYFVRNNKLYINSISENSTLEKNGIAVGDEIVSINSHVISQLPQSEFCEIFTDEFYFWKEEDTVINIKIKKQKSIVDIHTHKELRYK